MKPLFVLFILVFISIKLFPMGDSLLTRDSNEYTFDNKWGLILQESRYHGYTNSNDLVISIKKFLSPKSALRGGLTILGVFDNKHNNNEAKFNNSMDFYFDNAKNTINGKEFFIQYIYYPVKSRYVSLFIGGGPAIINFRQGVNESYYDVNNGKTYQYYLTANNKVQSIGASFCLGVEWMPFKHAGVNAEYNVLAVNTTHNENVYTRWISPSADKYSSPSNTSFEFIFSDIKAGVQFYL